MEQACSLIVNADDFGISEPVNRGIIQAHRNGIVTAASLMATGDAFRHAVEVSRSTPTLDIGIHLTLVEERPLLSPDKIPSLVDAGGHLHRSAVEITKRYLTGRLNLDEVRCELDAQICKVVDHGISPSHVDTHQHVHALPGIFAIVAGLCERHGIRAVRLPRERVRGYMLREPRSYIRLLQQGLLGVLCGFARKERLLSPDEFIGFFFGGRVTTQNIMVILKNLPKTGTCELMCHPGTADDGSRYRHWGYNWSSELAALSAPEVRRVLDDRGIRLISYRNIVSQG